MCFASTPAAPAVVPAPPPPPQLPDQAVSQAGIDARNRAALAYAGSQTILTGPQGLQTPANTTANSGTGKTLLGG
jgi:hypothetical protein